jgi:hypothetical protein
MPTKKFRHRHRAGVCNARQPLPTFVSSFSDSACKNSRVVYVHDVLRQLSVIMRALRRAEKNTSTGNNH